MSKVAWMKRKAHHPGSAAKRLKLYNRVAYFAWASRIALRFIQATFDTQSIWLDAHARTWRGYIK